MITADTVERIVGFNGDGLPVLSLYGRIEPGASRRQVHSRVLSLLDQVRPMARDHGLDHQARLSLRADAERIAEALDTERWQPGTMAVFACSGREFYEEVPLPRLLHQRVTVDGTPFARPMLAVLEEYPRACLLVIDRASARVWDVYQDEMQEETKVRDRVLRKPNFASNLAEDRVRNQEDELVKRHFRRVLESLAERLQTGGHDLLIVGGHEYEIPEFVQFLPLDLRQRLAGTFTVDPSTAPLAEIRASAFDILHRYERAQDQQMLSRLLEKAAMGGLAVLGLESSLWAASVAAIDTLLARAGATAPGVVCDESGWLARSGDTCPLCGKPTRPTPDVIDELAATVIGEGGSARHIEGDTKLSEYLVAAELRFPLPPAPAASS